MADKLSVQQLSTLNTYLKQHPNAKREDAIKLLFNSSAAKQTEKGVKVEHNKSDKKQTITLKSGLSVDVAKGTTVETKEGKITLSKTGRYSVTGKDGKTKYYAANGKELNEKYFKQIESSTGNVMVKNSKGVTVDVNKRLQNRIARASKELKHEEDNQGWMGKLWNGTKNTFGFGDSSDKVKEQLKQEQKLLKQFNQQPQNRAKIFKQLTGLEYSTKNMQDFVEGKIQLQSEKNLDGYKEGQKIAVDVASDVVSGVASFGVYTAAVVAAPFTAGTSIAVGVAAAGVVGAGVKAGLKASDTIGTDKKYDSLGSDLLMGSVNGAIAPLTAGAGGAVAKTVAVRAGVQVVKETGKQATKQVISQTTKNAAKQGFARTFKTNLAESIVQPNNYKLVGGTLTKRLGAYASEGAVDGALSGGAYSGVETAKNGGNTGEILQATALGFGMGAFMGGAMTSLAHSKGIVTGNKNATKTTDKYPQLTEIDKIARHDEINQANLSPHRFSDVSGKKAQKQVSDYLDHLLSIIPENTPEANNVNKVKKYADFILPDGTLISRNHAGDTGIPVMNPTTGQWEIPDVENAVLFWIKDVEGKEHVLPALTPENVSKAKRIIEYMSSQTEIPRENINTVQKEFLNKIKPNPKEITQDAVETSVTKNADNSLATEGKELGKSANDITPTPKPQGDSSLAPSGRGLGRGADDITPTPKAQGDSSLAPSGRGLGRGADDTTPTPKPQGAKSEVIQDTRTTFQKNKSKVSEEQLLKFKEDLKKQGLSKNGFLTDLKCFEENEIEELSEMYAQRPGLVRELTNYTYGDEEYYLTFSTLKNIIENYNEKGSLIEYMLASKQKFPDIETAINRIINSKDSNYETLERMMSYQDNLEIRYDKLNKYIALDKLKSLYWDNEDYFEIINYKDITGNFIKIDESIMVNPSLVSSLNTILKNGALDNVIKELRSNSGNLRITEKNNGILRLTCNGKSCKVELADYMGNISKIGYIQEENIIGNNIISSVNKDGLKITEMTKLSKQSNLIQNTYDKNGKLVRKDVIKQNEKRPGEFDITVKQRNDDGTYTTYKAGEVKMFGSKEQGMRSRRRLISRSGEITRQVKIEGPKGRGSEYTIVDSQGNVLFHNKRQSHKIDDNHYISRINNESYNIDFNENDISVTRINEKTGIKESIKLDFEQCDKELIELYKQLPGDYLFKIKELGIKIKKGYETDNAAYFPLENTIRISEELKNVPFTFAHELGHAFDHLKFSEEIRYDKDFQKIYNEELELFKKQSGIAESNMIDYFTEFDRADGEVIAETNALISGLEDITGHLGLRSVILQQNFPKTIVYLAKKLDMPIEEIAKTGKKVSADYDIAAVKAQHSAPTPKAQTDSSLATGGSKSVKGADDVTPKAQADSSLAPSGRGLGRGADDTTQPQKLKAVSRDELKANLQNGKKVYIQNDAFSESHINIPAGKNAAPGAKFLETDEAFKQILTDNKYDILFMHQKYKITGDLDGFVKDMYAHYVKETDIGQFAPELNIKSNTGTNAGSFNHENNSLMISKDYINKESDVAHNVAHELNHWFQDKEMLITTPQGPELLAYNQVLGNLKEMVKNGDITSQADFDRYLREWSVEDAAKLRITYQDLINSTKYPHNSDPASPYFQKANQYFDAQSNYEHTGNNYWNNFTEVESERRGFDAEKIYDKIINEDLALENQAIDSIMVKINERFGAVDNNTKLQILELAIEDLKNPIFANYSVDNFVNEFIRKLV